MTTLRRAPAVWRARSNGVEIAEDTITNYIQGVREQLGADDEDSWGTWLSQNDYTPASVREEVFNSYAQRELLKEGARRRASPSRAPRLTSRSTR